MSKGKENEYPVIDISELKPYEYNARLHSEEQLEKIGKSIKEFGFIAPIIIDENNVILVGNGRTEASKRIGLNKIPYRRVTNLNEAQKKAYILADNKLSDLASWDEDMLRFELENIDLDMSDYGFELLEMPEIEIEVRESDHEYYGDERERTNEAYNLGYLAENKFTSDFWQMPKLKECDFIPTTLLGFNYAKTSENKQATIHFYIDDYQFERIWNAPSKYIEVLEPYECIFTPDFSLYMDMPMPMKIWNIYRSRWIGAYYQQQGFKVIPTISWGEKETFEFAFKGIPKHNTVTISTIGVKEDKNALKIWEEGMKAMIQEIEPSRILVYGGKLDFDYQGIEVKYYENKVLEDWKERNDVRD